MRVFLCHSNDDKANVRNLYYRLIDDGFDVWLDDEKLLPGQDWDKEIVHAVRVSDTVIICLSHSSITKSGYVQKEIKVALDAADEKPEGAIFLIPAKLEKCSIPERLSRFQWVNLFEADGYDRLLKSLHFAESKKDESNNISSLTNTIITTGISNLPVNAHESNLPHIHESRNLIITIRPSGDREFDKKRIKEIYGVLVSLSGKDSFSFQIIENNAVHLIDFPNASTKICDYLLINLHNTLNPTTQISIQKRKHQ